MMISFITCKVIIEVVEMIIKTIYLVKTSLTSAVNVVKKTKNSHKMIIIIRQLLLNSLRDKTVEIGCLKQAREEKTTITVRNVDNRIFSCNLDKKKRNIDVQISYW
ncbi:MAG: hypothetical protein ACXAEU_03440 [Candidatus Hodarchaeales archaeon]|jgi:hypothetical protein